MTKHEPQIIPPEKGTSLSAAGRSWKSIVYTIAVVITGASQGEIGLVPNVRADRVFGRAMGERSDGSCFFASVDLPWVWDDHWDWRPLARQRLDTFLVPGCSCESRDSEVKLCDLHEGYTVDWSLNDNRMINETRIALKRMPYAKYGDGPLPGWSVMHRDYPWCRENPKNGVWKCFICHGLQESFMNPTWRNVFMNRHSHCGFGRPEPYAAKPIAELAKLLGCSLCVHCHKPTYLKDGILFHEGGYRSCNWAHTSYAEAA